MIFTWLCSSCAIILTVIKILDVFLIVTLNGCESVSVWGVCVWVFGIVRLFLR